jgi:branched-subunit amino acid transport protein
MEKDLRMIVILGMAVVTYIPRLVPVLLLSSTKLPKFMETWLRLVPVAVLTSLVAPSLFIQGEALAVGPENLFLWAAIPTGLVAWRTKNLFLSVLMGMAIVAVVRLTLLP